MDRPSVLVQYRFLQVLVHPIADERVTVGIVHFDGHHVRFAFRSERSPKAQYEVAEAIKGYEEVLTILRKNIPPGFSLESYRGLPHGDQGFLTWHKTQASFTKDPWNHFKTIVMDIGLVK